MYNLIDTNADLLILDSYQLMQELAHQTNIMSSSLSSIVSLILEKTGKDNYSYFTCSDRVRHKAGAGDKTKDNIRSMSASVQMKISQIKPKVIIGMGNLASLALTGLSIEKTKGIFYEGEEYSFMIVDSVMDLITDKLLREFFEVHIDKLSKILNGTFIKKDRTFLVKPKTVKEMVEFYMEHLHNSKAIFFDIEAFTGKAYNKDKDVPTYKGLVSMISFSSDDGMYCMCVPFVKSDMTPYWVKPVMVKVLALVRFILASDIPKGSHNGVNYDNWMIKNNLGMDINNNNLDTYLLIHSIVSESGGRKMASLASLASLATNEGQWKQLNDEEKE